jgi:hypothetical protein
MSPTVLEQPYESLVAEIVAMPPSEGDLLQKFRNGLTPDGSKY